MSFLRKFPSTIFVHADTVFSRQPVPTRHPTTMPMLLARSPMTSPWAKVSSCCIWPQQHLTQSPTPSFLKPSFTWLWDTGLGSSSVEGPSKSAVLPRGWVFGSLYLYLSWKWANSVYDFKYQLQADHVVWNSPLDSGLIYLIAYWISLLEFLMDTLERTSPSQPSPLSLVYSSSSLLFSVGGTFILVVVWAKCFVVIPGLSLSFILLHIQPTRKFCHVAL